MALCRCGKGLIDAGGDLLAAAPAAGAGTGRALDLLERRGTCSDCIDDIVSGRPHAGADELGGAGALMPVSALSLMAMMAFAIPMAVAMMVAFCAVAVMMMVVMGMPAFAFVFLMMVVMVSMMAVLAAAMVAMVMGRMGIAIPTMMVPVLLRLCRLGGSIRADDLFCVLLGIHRLFPLL